MADAELARRSALQGLALPAKAGIVAVADSGPAARWTYRGDPRDIATAFAVALSLEPNRAIVADRRAALWLGPDEWLLLAPEAERPSLATALQAALAGKAASLVDIAHRQCGLTIEGPAAERLLNTGCPLDLEATAFPVGMCTRTLLAKVEIVLWRTAAARFHLECQRSVVPYAVGILAAGLRGIASAS